MSFEGRKLFLGTCTAFLLVLAWAFWTRAHHPRASAPPDVPVLQPGVAEEETSRETARAAPSSPAAQPPVAALPTETARSTSVGQVEGAPANADVPHFEPRLYTGPGPTEREAGACSAPSVLFHTLEIEHRDEPWSSDTEAALLKIWKESASGPFDDSRFIVCKTSLCQVNVRYPVKTPRSETQQIGRFLQAFRRSEIAQQFLEWGSLHAARNEEAVVVVTLRRLDELPADEPESCLRHGRRAKRAS